MSQEGSLGRRDGAGVYNRQACGDFGCAWSDMREENNFYRQGQDWREPRVVLLTASNPFKWANRFRLYPTCFNIGRASKEARSRASTVKRAPGPLNWY
jgi:hypothetical protein